jgi:hypothetical protein
MYAIQMTYAGYCALGGSSNSRLFKRDIYLGGHYMHTAYFMMR